MGTRSRPSLWVTAVVLESGLVGLAYLLGWFFASMPKWCLVPCTQLLDHVRSAAWGVLATMPLLGGFFVLERSKWKPLVEVRTIVVEVTRRLCAGRPWWQIALLAIAAGIGEELLFRGWLQCMLVGWLGETFWGTAAAVVTTGLVFGMFHAVTRLYFVLAALVGMYLGALFVGAGQLLAPVTAHALYDFVALMWLSREAVCERNDP